MYLKKIAIILLLASITIFAYEKNGKITLVSTQRGTEEIKIQMNENGQYYWFYLDPTISNQTVAQFEHMFQLLVVARSKNMTTFLSYDYNDATSKRIIRECAIRE